MPHPILHFALPFSVAITFGASLKKSVLLGFIAVLPDFDVLFGVHPSLTHSVFVLPLALAVALTLKPMRSRKNFGLSSFSLLSHPTLDLFVNFNPILWPLLNRTIFIELSLTPFNAELLSSPVLFPKYSLTHIPLPPAWQLVVATVLISTGIALLIARISRRGALSKILTQYRLSRS